MLGYESYEGRHDPRKAAPYFERACAERVFANACGMAGEVIHVADPASPAALSFDRQGCESGDQVSCYNAACRSCASGRPADALGYLHSAVRVGLADPSGMEKDADLACVRELPEYRAFRASVGGYPRSLESGRAFLFFPDLKLVTPMFGNLGFVQVSALPTAFAMSALSAMLTLDKIDEPMSKYFANVEKQLRDQNQESSGLEIGPMVRGSANGIPTELHDYSFTRAGVPHRLKILAFDGGTFTTVMNLSFPRAYEKEIATRENHFFSRSFLVPFSEMKSVQREILDRWVDYRPLAKEGFRRVSANSVQRQYSGVPHPEESWELPTVTELDLMFNDPNAYEAVIARLETSDESNRVEVLGPWTTVKLDHSTDHSLFAKIRELRFSNFDRKQSGKAEVFLIEKDLSGPQSKFLKIVKVWILRRPDADTRSKASILKIFKGARYRLTPAEEKALIHRIHTDKILPSPIDRPKGSGAIPVS